MSEMYEHLITVSQTADAYSGSDCFLWNNELRVQMRPELHLKPPLNLKCFNPGLQRLSKVYLLFFG